MPEIFQKPFEVEGTGVLPEGGMTDTWIAWQMEYRWASGLRMSFTNSDNPNKQGCRFEGEEGWVHVNRGDFDVDDLSAGTDLGRALGLGVISRGVRENGTGFCYFDTREGAGTILEIRKS